MKKLLILFFIIMTVFVLPSFASPTGGGDFLLELSVPSFVDADLSVSESQVVFTNIIFENTVPVARSKMHILSEMSSRKTNLQLRSVEELMLRKTTMSELSGNLIRYVRLAA